MARERRRKIRFESLETRRVFAAMFDATTSFQILTVTNGGIPVWTNTIDGGTF